MYLQFLHFFIIAYDANAPGPCIEMLHASAYKPLTGAINSPENLLYPLPAFVFTTSNITEYRSSSMDVIVLLQVGDVLFDRTSSTYTPHGNVVSNADVRSSVAGWLIQ
jgi:hypothetical protein